MPILKVSAAILQSLQRGIPTRAILLNSGLTDPEHLFVLVIQDHHTMFGSLVVLLLFATLRSTFRLAGGFIFWPRVFRADKFEVLQSFLQNISSDKAFPIVQISIPGAPEIIGGRLGKNLY